MRILDSKVIRWYNDGECKLPSVTSILKLAPVPDFIQKWQDRIGIDEYIKHMEKLSERGKIIHSVCENYFLGSNKEIPTDFEYQHFIKGFYTFISRFGNNIKPPIVGYQIEKSLANLELGYAGTIDLIANFFDKLTLIDWKTSSSTTFTKEERETYGMQGVAYAIMWNRLNPENQIQQVMIQRLTNKRKDGLGDSILIQKAEFQYYFKQFIPYVLFMNSVYNDGYIPNIKLLETLG